MGFFDNLKRRKDTQFREDPGVVEASAGFTVIDVETTGLSTHQDRILEIAVVRTDSQGHVLGEWVRRVDPEGPVGATHIHGITAADVAGAPKFRELIPALNAWFAGNVVVAHNARFDLAFLRAEYAYAGWSLPWLPSLCTLEASNHYLPGMDRRRLADCCDAAHIRHHDAHSALGDARAAACLLSHYLDPRVGIPPRSRDLDLLRESPTVQWPSTPTQRRQTPETKARVDARIRVSLSKPAAPDLVQLLADFSLVDALDEGAPAGALAYLETLAEVLEDGEISEDEVQILNEVAMRHELSGEDRISADRALLMTLSHLALDDGKVTKRERAELLSTSDLLGLPKTLLTRTLDKAEKAREARLSADLRPLPDDWPHGIPLRVGDKVAFTGCNEQFRESLELRAEQLGVRVMNNISRKTAMLVTDGDFVGTKAEAAEQVGSRIIHPAVFEILLQNLQPAVPRLRSTAKA